MFKNCAEDELNVTLVQPDPVFPRLSTSHSLPWAECSAKSFLRRILKKENNLSQIIVFHHLAMFHQYSNKPFEDKNNNQFACIHWNKMIKIHQIWMKLHLLQNNVNIIPASVSFLFKLYSSSSTSSLSSKSIITTTFKWNQETNEILCAWLPGI